MKVHFFFLFRGIFEGYFILFSLSSVFHFVYWAAGGQTDKRRMGCAFALLLLFFIHPK